MRLAEVDTEKVEEVMLPEARVDVRRVIHCGDCGGHVGKDSGSVEVSGAQRTALPSGTVLEGLLILSRST